MDISLAKAANAYADRMRSMGEEESGGAAAAGGASFKDMLSGTVDSLGATLRQADQLQTQSVTGKVDLSELVTAVSNAELMLDAVVAVRDRVITAYQDIIRMPI